MPNKGFRKAVLSSSMPSSTDEKLAAAKAELNRANRRFPGLNPVTPAPKTPLPPVSTPSDINPLTGAATGKELEAKRRNIDEYQKATR